MASTRYNNTDLVYTTTSLRGWTVKYQPGLWQHHPGLRNLLLADLAEIESLLSKEIIKIMKNWDT